MKFFLLFLVIFPASEIGLFLLSANWIGVLPTVLLIILTGFLGAALAKKQGIEVTTKFSAIFSMEKMPGDAILDGLCIFIGGMLLLLPGFYRISSVYCCCCRQRAAVSNRLYPAS